MNSPDLTAVLSDELNQIERSRALRLGQSQMRRSTAESLIGLSFSGGGIRSASFNLGVLQALAKAKVLRNFDYLSTVSGGGYIGSWLMGWMHHQRVGVKAIEEYLSATEPTPRAERPEVHFLRDYSNYLTPRRGLLSIDFLAFVGTYLRNTLLNQFILVLLLLALLLAPGSILAALHLLESAEDYWGPHLGWLQNYSLSQDLALLAGTLFGLVAVIFMGLNLVVLTARQNNDYPWFTQHKYVQLLIVLPLFLAAGMYTYGLAGLFSDFPSIEHSYVAALLLGIALYAGPWCLALVIRRIFWSKMQGLKAIEPSAWVILLTAAITGALVGLLLLPFSRILLGSDDLPLSNWHVMTFGTPAFALIMLAAGVIHIGLLGREMLDGNREWWARLGACLGFCSLAWFGLFMISIYFPPALGRLFNLGHGKTVWTGLATWILSTLYGVLFGKSSKTADILPETPLRGKVLNYAARITPYLFILGFLLILSLIDAKVVHWLAGSRSSIYDSLNEALFDTWKLPVTGLAFFAAALFFSWRVDVNEFSVHYLYRNRLVRCYLGASVEDRHPQPFTGFSDGDDVPLADLAIPDVTVASVDDRPLPIFNTSLNVVRGRELALQTRKARSFMFTPSFIGFTRPIPGTNTSESIFARTSSAASDRPNSRNGARLGTAMAISGAAASPNMGFYSSPALAFLMTLFDVRLGWWLANPKLDAKDPEGSRRRWRLGSPNNGFYWLLRELLGATNDDSRYLYLSDGGHFENLGIYELVRRRCRLIVASDASCDPGCACNDLHNAMERCRTDFGVEIEMNASELDKLRPVGQPKRAQAHYAVGVVHYNPADSAEDGVLIYLKPALVASDGADILGYATQNKSFPHDTTANQWFDELRFENYRALGETTGHCAAETILAAVAHCMVVPAPPVVATPS